MRSALDPGFAHSCLFSFRHKSILLHASSYPEDIYIYIFVCRVPFLCFRDCTEFLKVDDSLVCVWDDFDDRSALWKASGAADKWGFGGVFLAW